MAEVITVSALNHYVKMLLDANDILFEIALRGEIANFVQNARSGHCYFSLRDEARCPSSCLPPGRGNARCGTLPCDPL